ncbi:MAG: nitroreductase [Bacteroidota bacterium]
MQDKFQLLSDIISQRRTIKPQQMNAAKIAPETINQLLQLADWAPTHGRTEPWRFFVFADEKVNEFCTAHAQMHRQAHPEKSTDDTFNKLSSMGENASHIILAAMCRGHLPKIPVIEEIAATAAAIQNILLGAQSMGIATYWGTGGSIHHPEMKDYLGLGEHDHVMGALYLGYTNQQLKEGQRNIPIEVKVKWM